MMIEKISYQDWLQAGSPTIFTDTVELKWMPDPESAGFISELIWLRKMEQHRIDILNPTFMIILPFVSKKLGSGIFKLDNDFVKAVDDYFKNLFDPTNEYLLSNPEFKEQYEQLKVIWMLGKE